MTDPSFDPGLDRRRFDFELIRVLNDVKDELRREISASEDRVQGSIAELRTDFEQATTTHAGIHAAEGESRSIAHQRFEDFMRKADIAQARRDGALGVVRFGADLVGRNWRGILALGTAAAILLGNIRVEVIGG